MNNITNFTEIKMQNKYLDLHNHLMAEMERLGDEDLLNSPEKIQNEVNRAKAMVEISSSITELGRMQIEALRVAGEYNYKKSEMPLLLQQ